MEKIFERTASFNTANSGISITQAPNMAQGFQMDSPPIFRKSKSVRA